MPSEGKFQINHAMIDRLPAEEELTLCTIISPGNSPHTLEGDNLTAHLRQQLEAASTQHVTHVCLSFVLGGDFAYSRFARINRHQVPDQKDFVKANDLSDTWLRENQEIIKAVVAEFATKFTQLTTRFERWRDCKEGADYQACEARVRGQFKQALDAERPATDFKKVIEAVVKRFAEKRELSIEQYGPAWCDVWIVVNSDDYEQQKQLVRQLKAIVIRRLDDGQYSIGYCKQNAERYCEHSVVGEELEQLQRCFDGFEFPEENRHYKIARYLHDSSIYGSIKLDEIVKLAHAQIKKDHGVLLQKSVNDLPAHDQTWCKESIVEYLLIECAFFTYLAERYPYSLASYPTLPGVGSRGGKQGMNALYPVFQQLCFGGDEMGMQFVPSIVKLPKQSTSLPVPSALHNRNDSSGSSSISPSGSPVSRPDSCSPPPPMHATRDERFTSLLASVTDKMYADTNDNMTPAQRAQMQGHFASGAINSYMMSDSSNPPSPPSLFFARASDSPSSMSPPSSPPSASLPPSTLGPSASPPS